MLKCGRSSGASFLPFKFFSTNAFVSQLRRSSEEITWVSLFAVNKRLLIMKGISFIDVLSKWLRKDFYWALPCRERHPCSPYLLVIWKRILIFMSLCHLTLNFAVRYLFFASLSWETLITAPGFMYFLLSDQEQVLCANRQTFSFSEFIVITWWSADEWLKRELFNFTQLAEYDINLRIEKNYESFVSSAQQNQSHFNLKLHDWINKLGNL